MYIGKPQYHSQYTVYCLYKVHVGVDLQSDMGSEWDNNNLSEEVWTMVDHLPDPQVYMKPGEVGEFVTDRRGSVALEWARIQGVDKSRTEPSDT